MSTPHEMLEAALQQPSPDEADTLDGILESILDEQAEDPHQPDYSIRGQADGDPDRAWEIAEYYMTRARAAADAARRKRTALERRIARLKARIEEKCSAEYEAIGMAEHQLDQVDGWLAKAVAWPFRQLAEWWADRDLNPAHDMKAKHMDLAAGRIGTQKRRGRKAGLEVLDDAWFVEHAPEFAREVTTTEVDREALESALQVNEGANFVCLPSGEMIPLTAARYISDTSEDRVYVEFSGKKLFMDAFTVSVDQGGEDVGSAGEPEDAN